MPSSGLTDSLLDQQGPPLLFSPSNRLADPTASPPFQYRWANPFPVPQDSAAFPQPLSGAMEAEWRVPQAMEDAPALRALHAADAYDFRLTLPSGQLVYGPDDMPTAQIQAEITYTQPMDSPVAMPSPRGREPFSFLGVASPRVAPHVFSNNMQRPIPRSAASAATSGPFPAEGVAYLAAPAEMHAYHSNTHEFLVSPRGYSVFGPAPASSATALPAEYTTLPMPDPRRLPPPAAAASYPQPHPQPTMHHSQHPHEYQLQYQQPQPQRQPQHQHQHPSQKLPQQYVQIQQRPAAPPPLPQQIKQQHTQPQQQHQQQQQQQQQQAVYYLRQDSVRMQFGASIPAAVAQVPSATKNTAAAAQAVIPSQPPKAAAVKSTRYVCSDPTCAKALSGKTALTRHMRIHTGEKPFKCPSCPAIFRQKSTMLIHQNIHEPDQQPFVCHICSSRFRHRATLARHVRAAHNGGKTSPVIQ